MCIIAISPSGTEKLSPFFKEALRNSALINRDGMGFAFKQAHNQTVFYQKGFMNVERLLEAIQSYRVKKEDELIVHFRFKTHGKVCSENCHPFVLTPDNASVDCSGPSTTLFPVMFHNGTFPEFGYSNEYHSDTYNFAYDFMRIRDMYSMVKEDTTKFMQVFGDVVGSSNRLAFLFPRTSKKFVTIGSFVEEDGYYFSNHGYKVSPIRKMQLAREAVDSKIPISINKRFERLKNDAKERKNMTLFETEAHYNALAGKITFTPDMFDELVYVANRDIAGIRVKKGDKFIIDEWKEGMVYQQLIKMSDNSFVNFIREDDIHEDFTLLPKMAYIDKYHGYFKLSQMIKPTKSQIKKLARIYSRAKNTRKQPPMSTKVTIKYNDKYMNDIRLDSLQMFLKDHEHFVEYSTLLA